MAVKQPYDMNVRQMRKREEMIYAMDNVTMAQAFVEMQSALETYVPKEYWDPATFGHEKRCEPYSDSEYSRFFVWWMSPETDKEFEERVAYETKAQEAREARDRQMFEELSKKYGKK